MPLRLSEIHPVTVHLPITLAPVALLLDAVGAATGNRGLLGTGRVLMGAAFAGAVGAGVTGVLAQGVSKVEEGEPHDLLTTHRTINGALTLLLGALAASRALDDRPGPGYFAGGAAAVALMGYSSYLGSQMSYEHGVGSARAGGLRDRAAIGRSSPSRLAEAVVEAIGRAIQETLADIRNGRFLPFLRRYVRRPITAGPGMRSLPLP